MGATLSLKDLELIDKHCVNQLLELQGMTQGTEEERILFDALDYTWSTAAADGKTIIDLCPNGRTLPVRFEDRFEYARRVETARLNEFRFVVSLWSQLGHYGGLVKLIRLSYPITQ